MFRVGLNPYGLTYTLGLQGAGTPRANPRPHGLEGLLAAAERIGAACVEFDDRWLLPMRADGLARLADRVAALGMTPICSHGLSQEPGETLEASIRCAAALGGALLRLHVTPVLEGARAAWGPTWDALLAHARRTLAAESPKAADAGVPLAVEDHQDLGSRELLQIAAESDGRVGIVFDTGNPFAVGEDPVAFAERVAPHVRHVHLKDYRAQFSAEGFWLVRCAIGEGAVPFQALAEVLARHHGSLTASLEPGALEGRHIRLFTPQWWHGYVPVSGAELGVALGRLRRNRIEDDADRRTPWEREASGEDIAAYERDQIDRSAAAVRAWGW
jgi:sugar phosphate isomerase/epimerase